MKTSLEFSKALAEAGFKEVSPWIWADQGEGRKHKLCRLPKGSTITTANGERPTVDYYAYDILNDLCVEYAKEVFGEPRVIERYYYCQYIEWDEYISIEGYEKLPDEDKQWASPVYKHRGWEKDSATVFRLRQQGKPREEIESYFKKHSILFNKKN